MVTHKGTQVLQTDRLILRSFRMEDSRAMYDNWASDPEVTKFLTWPPHSSPAVTELVLRDWITNYGKPNFYQWAIVLRDRNLPIGSISVVRHDDSLQTAEIGYCIGRAWWHRGITTEALGAVIRFLFREVGMRRIEARHDVNNPHSGGVMQKCGMAFLGIQPQSDRNNQGICDTARYFILADQEGA